MSDHDSRISGQPLMDAAALATLLIEGPRHRDQLVADVRSLVAPWLMPTAAAVLASLRRLEQAGAVGARGASILEPMQHNSPAALRVRLEVAIDTGASSHLPLAHLMLALVHPVLPDDQARKLEQRLVSAHEKAFGVGSGTGSRAASMHRRASHFRTALAGANLQLLQTFLRRVPALKALGQGALGHTR